MQRKRKTRSMIREPRGFSGSNKAKVTPYLIANGTPDACIATTLVYCKGNCPEASVTNPHNRGEQADTCNSCWSVS